MTSQAKWLSSFALYTDHHHIAQILSTILDKTVEKIVYLDSIFLNIVAVPVLPSLPSPVVYLKKPDSWAFVGNNIELEEADFFPQRRRFGNSFVA